MRALVCLVVAYVVWCGQAVADDPAEVPEKTKQRRETDPQLLARAEELVLNHYSEERDRADRERGREYERYRQWKALWESQRHLPPVPLDRKGRPVGLSATVTLIEPAHVTIRRSEWVPKPLAPDPVYFWESTVHTDNGVDQRYAIVRHCFSLYWPNVIERLRDPLRLNPARSEMGATTSMAVVRRRRTGELELFQIPHARKGRVFETDGYYELMFVVAAYPLDGATPIVLDAAEAIVEMFP